MRTVKFILLVMFVVSVLSVMPIVSVNGTNGPNEKKIEEASAKGLAYLARTQNKNGSWTCRIGYKLNYDYIGREYDNVCVTALAAMSFMANGNIPGRGKYGKNVANALEFVLSCARMSDGYITKHGTRMYEHAFCTLFLAEIYGMTLNTVSGEEGIKVKLKKAVNLIIQSQNAEGGWRYQPAPIDADISMTVTTLQALRAARNVGISVPKTVIDKAVAYVKKCAKNADGSFNYQLTPHTRSTFSLTAAGVTALMSAGDYDSLEVQRGLKYLLLHMLTVKGDQFEFHYFYGHYYATQAMYQAGGKYWETYRSDSVREILRTQKANGSWQDNIGPTYATAMATLILQIPNEYLPIFQR